MRPLTVRGQPALSLSKGGSRLHLRLFSPLTPLRSLIEEIFGADQPDERAQAIRRLFVETLDFNPDSGQIPLTSTSAGVSLPHTADRIAALDGVHVCYVALDTRDSDRVRKPEATAVARQLADILGDDLLLVVTNTSRSQLHVIHPVFQRVQPTLRRIVIERDLPRRTAVQQIANIYSNYLRSRSIRATLDSAFDVEPVTRRFFEEYKRVFDSAEYLIIESNNTKQNDWRLFVQTLFNRLMFVHFLSRKGWLTFEGNKDYLHALWNSYQSRSDEASFYRDRLRPLFFCGLNNQSSTEVNRPNGYMESVYGNVPFLNGGLFDPTDLDQLADIEVPDKAIEPILGRLFKRFNFTVMESTPFDIEVAVDPEMLGKVFEEMINERNATGSYYTPRPVVSFMCREALKSYLEDRDIGLSSETIQRFVDERHTTDIPLIAALQISRALDELTAVDPACGSGAYLLGMLQELVDLHTVLFNVGVDPRSLHDLKLHIIERNLYGVDEDDFAVNVAMLRLWLSLAIEFDGPQPRPLPNLDFKIVTGDSLRGPDPLYHLHIANSRLGELKNQYMYAITQSSKQTLQTAIDVERARLIEALGGAGSPAGSVNWRIDFAEVFEARNGFDIVVANPPYVVIKDKHLRRQYLDGVYGRMNTYGLFIQRSIQLLRIGGQLCFINPRTLLTDRYFSKLRSLIKRDAAVRGVVLIEDRHRTFARVLQECIVLHLSKPREPLRDYEIHTRAVQLPSDLNHYTAYTTVRRKDVLLSKDFGNAFYVGTSDLDYYVLDQMTSTGLRLTDLGFQSETGKIQFNIYRDYALPDFDAHASRLIWAENVQRYTQRDSVKRIGKEWLHRSIRDYITPPISGLGIVTQRTTASEQPRRIIATLISPDDFQSTGVYSENGTNFISLDRQRAHSRFLQPH